MRKRSSLTYFILLFSSSAFCQELTKSDDSASELTADEMWEVRPMEIHWLDRIDESTKYVNWNKSIQYHTSVLPMIPHYPKGKSTWYYTKPKSTPLQLTINFGKVALNKSTAAIQYGYKNVFKLYPIFDMNLGANIDSLGFNGLFTLGLGAAAELSTRRWHISAKLLPYTTDSPFIADSVQRNLAMDLGTTRPITGQLFQRSEMMAVFRPNRFFALIGGYGKNFLGDGYRSLLLSDNASAYPYMKLETSFGPVKYVNLYNVWNDNSVDPANRGLDKMKFSAMHYLSWNVTKEFNISIFESVVWQYQDTLVDRGFDINYLNPVVFYRPVEYSQGSADNVLLGLNSSVKLYGGHCFYTQFILDEFLLSEIRARSRWWANKYGFQFGYKTNSLMNDQLYLQTEFNVVRPFTYAHVSSTLAYGHLNASAAHPLGANFWEVLNILSFQKKKAEGEKGKLRITNKLTWASFGRDTNATSFGQNVFASYQNRAGEYDQKIMQGLRMNVLNEHFIVEHPLVESIGLYANFRYNYRMAWNKFGTDHQHYFSLGIRSRIWNKYSDY